MGSKKSAGEEITVYHNNDSNPNCDSPTNIILRISNEAGQWFLGIKDNFLFSDIGTGPEVRKFVIYDLNDSKKAFEDEYISLIKGDLEISNSIVEYWKVNERFNHINNCPESLRSDIEALDWKNGYSLLDKHSFNLKTFEHKSLSKFRCYISQ